jgi:hypothetical protein
MRTSWLDPAQIGDTPERRLVELVGVREGFSNEKFPD